MKEKETKSRKTLKLIGSIGIGTFIIVVVTLLFAFTDIKSIGNAEEKPYSDYLENKLLKDYQDCPEKTDREYLPRKMFCQLPDIPSNFREFEVLYEYGKIEDLELIPEAIWAQPEFSTVWSSQTVKKLQHPPENRFGAAYYPQIDNADAGIKIKQGDTAKHEFLVRNTPLSIFWLGMKLVPTYPEHQILDYEEIYINTLQDPEVAEECFDVEITPNLFTLAPSFPVMVYDHESEEYYKRLITIKIHVSEDCPVGNYIVGVNPTSPGKEYSDNYMFRTSEHRGGRQILTKYTSVGGYIGITRPYFRAFIEVEK